MTIIKPKQKYNIELVSVAFFGLLFIAGGMYIHLYNEYVKIKHGVEEVKQELIEAEVANAELKRQVYQVTDPSMLEEMAQKKGMILERKPEYVSYDWR